VRIGLTFLLNQRTVKVEQVSFLTYSFRSAEPRQFFWNSRPLLWLTPFSGFFGAGRPVGEVFMLTKIMKWVSILALIGAMFFWTPASNYAVLLQFVICGSAVLVAIEAARSGKHLWACAFGGVALLFNPLLIFTFFHSALPWVSVLCSSMFLASLVFLKTVPTPSILSIAYPGQRSQSL
jgi:hypothetical protein